MLRIGCVLFILLVSVSSLQAGEISDAIRDHILATFDLDADMTEIEIRTHLDSIQLSDSTEIIISCREYPEPRGYFPLKVLLQEGSGEVRSISSAVDVKHFENVYVAKSRVKSREPLSSGDFTIERIEIDKFAGNPIKDLSILDGMQASKTISRGKILVENMLEPIPVVRRGERVRIIYNSGTLTIESTGIARKDAIEGEMVEVKNTASGKKIYGRASGEGLVMVE